MSFMAMVISFYIYNISLFFQCTAGTIRSIFFFFFLEIKNLNHVQSDFAIWHTWYISYLPFPIHAIFTYPPTHIIPLNTQFSSTMRLADIKDCLKTECFGTCPYLMLGDHISFQL